MTSMPHPPYSPELALSDIFWFPWMEKAFKGKYFADVEEAKQKSGRSTKRHQDQQDQKLF